MNWMHWFLSNEGGEITGILKETSDEMSKDLIIATHEETTAIKRWAGSINSADDKKYWARNGLT